MQAPRVSVGLNVGSSPPLRLVRWTRRMARAIGAESIWVVDHLTGWFPTSVWDGDLTWLARRRPAPNAYYDWQVLAGYLAAGTRAMSIGVGVTEPVRRHPVVLAQAAVSLSHLARRPFVLGIGAGEAENITPYGLPFERPVARLEEALRIIRMCFDQTGPFDFHGEFYTLIRAGFDLPVGRAGRPQIWVAAHRPRMLKLTGRYGDGWYPTIPMSPEDYRRSLETIADEARAAGRSPDEITPSMQVFYVAARDDREVRRHLEHPAIRFLALLAPDRAWRQVGLAHPLGDGFGGMVDFVPERYTAAEIRAAIDAVPVELLADQLVAGTPDQVVERLQALARAGMRHVVLAPVAPLVSRRSLVYTLRTLPGLVRRLRTGT